MKLRIKFNIWITLVILSNANLFSLIRSSPIEIDIIDFNDDWDYQTLPSNTPLLHVEGKKHQLPSTSNRQAKEIPDILQLLDLNENSPLGNAVGQLGDSVRSKLPCSVCKLGASLLQTAVQKGESFDEIKTKFVSLCVGFEIQSEKVCSGIFDAFGPEILPVLSQIKIGPDEICRLCLGESCEEVPIPQHDWEIELPKVKKPEVKEVPLPQPGNPTLKVLHISDTHFDPDYLEGSISNCGEPLCCRSNSGSPKNNATVIPAGKWGAYDTCDAPQVLIENMLQNIAKQHPDIDYIIWTGDLPPHDIWNQTKNGSLEILRECVQQMLIAFPDVPILPALGNHEGIPAGSFAPPWNHHPDHSIAYLYEEANKQWKKWLPETEESTILHGGFYSVLIRPGFRLISLNMNYCHSLSWWLLVNSTDPAKELKWLMHQLQKAEDKGEKVHIIGHIPPGVTDCLKTWSKNYYTIVNRYENTIAAQFFGHTHADEFEVFYDTEHFSKPTGIAYLGPSVTPWSGQNPAYRIYYVDGDHKDSTREVIDHETWIMNLEKANTKGENNPEWFKLYSAMESYGMSNLRPKEWNNLIYRMALDPKLFQQFYKFYHRDSPVSPKYGDKEKLQILCDLKSGKSQDRHHLCHDLEIGIRLKRTVIKSPNRANEVINVNIFIALVLVTIARSLV